MREKELALGVSVLYVNVCVMPGPDKKGALIAEAERLSLVIKFWHCFLQLLSTWTHQRPRELGLLICKTVVTAANLETCRLSRAALPRAPLTPGTLLPTCTGLKQDASWSDTTPRWRALQRQEHCLLDAGSQMWRARSGAWERGVKFLLFVSVSREGGTSTFLLAV